MAKCLSMLSPLQFTMFYLQNCNNHFLQFEELERSKYLYMDFVRKHWGTTPNLQRTSHFSENNLCIKGKGGRSSTYCNVGANCFFCNFFLGGGCIAVSQVLGPYRLQMIPRLWMVWAYTLNFDGVG